MQNEYHTNPKQTVIYTELKLIWINEFDIWCVDGKHCTTFSKG